MFNYTPKHQLKVEGKRSESVANQVGQKLANAALIFACGFTLAALTYATAALIAVIFH